MKKNILIIMLFLIPSLAFAVESQERLDAFDSVERSGINAKYYAGVEQGKDKVRISVTDKWYQLTSDKKKAFVNQATSLFFGMGGARRFKEAKSFFVVSFVHKKSGETVATWTGLTGVELSK